MVQLFLQVPTKGSNVDSDALKARRSLLSNVEHIIKSVIKSGGRYEARLWLCNTVSSIHSLGRHDQRELFLDLLEMKNSRRDVATRVLRLIFEKKPERAGSVLARKCHMLEEFFQGNKRRIMQWFDHFAVTGESTHKRGARALSQYAFVNRDICWEELEWKGKHGQSPAVVATKPHYFCDLDVLRTVENFLEYVPDFWSSDEFANSVKDGEILQIDTDYFVDQFSYLMYEENSKDAWRLVEDFFMDEQFSSLCQHLLIQLDEQRLLDFLKSLGKLISKSLQCKELAFQCCWLEVLLSAHSDHISLGDLILLNCVISKRRQLWWLMNDEEQVEERGRMEEFLRSANQLTDAVHFSLMTELAKTEFPDALKWIGIQSWIIFSDLLKECESADSCESLFSCNKIEFRKADEYSLVQSDGYPVSHISDADDEDLARSGHKSRKKNRRRKRPRYESDEDHLDQLIEVPYCNTTNIIRSQCRSWRLSTDAFSASWDIADIPDHLSSCYFTTWVKWVCFR